MAEVVLAEKTGGGRYAAAMYKTCAQCRSAIPAVALFCPQCGKPQHGKGAAGKRDGRRWIPAAAFVAGLLMVAVLLFFRVSVSHPAAQLHPIVAADHSRQEGRPSAVMVPWAVQPVMTPSIVARNISGQLPQGVSRPMARLDPMLAAVVRSAVAARQYQCSTILGAGGPISDFRNICPMAF